MEFWSEGNPYLILLFRKKLHIEKMELKHVIIANKIEIQQCASFTFIVKISNKEGSIVWLFFFT